MPIATQFLISCLPAILSPAGTDVSLIPTPDRGVQPRAAVDAGGALHLVAFHGPRESGELLYRRSADAGKTFGRPLKVTNELHAATAVRASACAQLALGKGSRAHVVWHRPASEAGPAEVLYTRLDDANAAFETPRAMSSARAGLDGGSAVAADENGRVWIAWHAPSKPDAGVKERALFVVESNDDGASFGPERMALPGRVSACSSIQLLAGLDAGFGFVYRSHVDGKFKDKEFFHRETTVVFSEPGADATWSVDEWPSRECLATTYSCARSPRGWVVAFQSQSGVSWTRVDPTVFEHASFSPPGESASPRHPAVAVDSGGQVLLAWIADAREPDGATLEWSLFTPEGKPVADTVRCGAGVAPENVLSAVSFADGRFAIVH